MPLDSPKDPAIAAKAALDPQNFALANCIRALSIDAVNAANSGHPGAPMGMADAADTDTLRELLLAYGLPVSIPAGLAPEALLAHMRLDKKNIAGRLRLVLWRGIGKAEVVPDVDEAAVLAVLTAT